MLRLEKFIQRYLSKSLHIGPKEFNDWVCFEPGYHQNTYLSSAYDSSLFTYLFAQQPGPLAQLLLLRISIIEWGLWDLSKRFDQYQGNFYTYEVPKYIRIQNSLDTDSTAISDSNCTWTDGKKYQSHCEHHHRQLAVIISPVFTSHLL